MYRAFSEEKAELGDTAVYRRFPAKEEMLVKVQPWSRELVLEEDLISEIANQGVGFYGTDILV